MLKYRYTVLFSALVGLSLLGACDKTRHSPGWDYFPDMFYPVSYETYSINPNFRDSMTMRTPVNGTIPVGYVPFAYTTDPADRQKAGMELVNPLRGGQVNLERGKNLYNVFCAQCHGATGAGDGHLFTSKLYPMPPRTLTGEIARNLKDGEIYHTITMGFGSMGPHGQQVRPDERWEIVLYVRDLQRSAQQ